MKCKFCGKNIKKNSEICACCGKSIYDEPETKDLIDAMPEIRDEFDKISQLQAQDKKRKERKKKREENKKSRIVVAIVLVVLILLGVAGGVVLYNIKGKQTKEKDAKKEVQTNSAIECELRKTIAGIGFTSEKITDAKSAKEAIKSAKGTLSIVDVDKEFELEKEIEIGDSKVYRFRQMYEGIPVYNGEVAIMADKDGEGTALNGIYVATDGLSTDYKINKGSASAKITEYVNSAGAEFAVVKGIRISDVEKVICYHEDKAYLAYSANISGYNEKNKFLAYDVFVDGVSGEGICMFYVSSYENGEALTGDEIEESYIYEIAAAGDKFNWNDPSVETARENLKISEIEAGEASPFVTSVKSSVDDAYGYFASAFNWKGLDGKGSEFKVYVNSNEYVEEDLPTEKAMYSNGELMFFREDWTQGDVDYNTVAHEYAHGVMSNIVGFAGTNSCTENAAIAEGLADVFAELAEAQKKGTAPDWMHGERNMYSPGEGYHISTNEAPTISTVKECYEYSTIVSHMAAFMSDRTNSTAIQNEFWFKVMCLMTKGTDFEEFQSIMNVVAAEMYEDGKFSDSQYSGIITGIEMVGLSEEDLYSEETYQ